MYCRVLQLWENGHLLPHHRLKSARNWSEGEFSLEQCRHEVFNRTQCRAKLIHTIEAGGHGNEMLPYLYDASVITLQAEWMRVSGFYFDSCTQNALMQTWHVVVLANNYREWVMKKSMDQQ